MSTKLVRIYRQQIRGLAGKGRSWYDTAALNLKRVPYTPIRLFVDKLVVKSRRPLHGSFSFIKAHISFNYKAGFWFLLGLLVGMLFLGHASGQTPAVSDPIVSATNNKPLKPQKPLKTPNLQPESQLAPKSLIVAQTPSPAIITSSDGLPAILLAIRACESSNNYTAQNPYSTASGAFQFLDSTWNGYDGYSRAMYAPPAAQDAKAILIYESDGTSPWISSSSCWQ